MFVCFLPRQTVLRIWDAILYEGSKVLFRVAITLVKMHESELLACRNFPEIVNLFKRMPTSPTVTNCHEFVEVREKPYVLGI